MKVAFITEMGFVGKIPRNHPNMRTEFAWMCALEADHYHFGLIDNVKDYDLVITIIPKKNIEQWMQVDIVSTLKNNNVKVGVMQEGPNWYFQDHSLAQQIWYYNTLITSDIIFTHNIVDRTYYKGLTNHNDVRVLQSLMIEDAIKKEDLCDEKNRDGVIIGGNFVSWYGGFDSFMVASEITSKVFAPSMGRKQPGEEQIVHHLPYSDWTNWITQLSKFKIGVHLMRTHAAGTFALNCAYLGIPCIGYQGLDTQEICHSNLSVEFGDLVKAKKLIKRLQESELFYEECSELAKYHYRRVFGEEQFLKQFNNAARSLDA
jgi:hypothetical protein